MRSLNLSSFFPSHRRPSPPFIFTLFSSFSSLSKTPNPLLKDFLINTLNFPESRALTIATRFHYLKSLERPQALLQYFQTLGFSHSQIQSSVRCSPLILVADVNKTIKPKIDYFQQLGLSDSHLGEFVSRSASIFPLHFERKLVPCVELLRNIFVGDKNNEKLFNVLSTCPWLVCVDMNSILLPNIRVLESCGIVGSQLAILLRDNPRVFTLPEPSLRSFISKVTDMGFDMKSRMFVYAFNAICSCSNEKFERKIKTYERFGFSRDEYMKMVRKTPYLLKNSVEKSTAGLDFYLNTLGVEREVLMRKPVYLLNSIENRVIPRYKVLQIIKSKRLLKKEPSFFCVIDMTEEAFLDKYISKFIDHAEELLVAYKGHLLDSSSEEEMSAN